MKMNTKLLNKIIRHIREKPKRFNMKVLARKSRLTTCGTAACIAGWAVLLTRADKQDKKSFHSLIDSGLVSFWYAGASAIGLDQEEARQLFEAYNWPERYRKPLMAAQRHGHHRKAVEIAVRRIRHFIKTKGVE